MHRYPTRNKVKMSESKQTDVNQQSSDSISTSSVHKELTQDERDATLAAALGIDKANLGIAYRTGAKPVHPDPNVNPADSKVDSNVLLFKMFEKFMQSQQVLLQTLNNNNNNNNHDMDVNTPDPDTGMSKKEQRLLAEALKMKISEKFTGEAGEKISSLLSVIEKHKRMFGWSDKVAVYVAGTKMEGKAGTWYTDSVADDAAESWDLFKDICLDRWTRRVSSHLVPHHTGTYIPNIKQGGSERCESYLARVRDNLIQINSTEAHWLILNFLSGLRPNILEQVKLSIGDSAPSIEELLKEAIRIEVALGSKAQPSTPSSDSGAKGGQGKSRGDQKESKNRICRSCGQGFTGQWKDHAPIVLG